jgi:hypothetical protein
MSCGKVVAIRGNDGADFWLAEVIKTSEKQLLISYLKEGDDHRWLVDDDWDQQTIPDNCVIVQNVKLTKDGLLSTEERKRIHLAESTHTASYAPTQDPAKKQLHNRLYAHFLSKARELNNKNSKLNKKKKEEEEIQYEVHLDDVEMGTSHMLQTLNPPWPLKSQLIPQYNRKVYNQMIRQHPKMNNISFRTLNSLITSLSHKITGMFADFMCMWKGRRTFQHDGTLATESKKTDIPYEDIKLLFTARKLVRHSVLAITVSVRGEMLMTLEGERKIKEKSNLLLLIQKDLECDVLNLAQQNGYCAKLVTDISEVDPTANNTDWQRNGQMFFFLFTIQDISTPPSSSSSSSFSSCSSAAVASSAVAASPSESTSLSSATTLTSRPNLRKRKEDKSELSTPISTTRRKLLVQKKQVGVQAPLNDNPTGEKSTNDEKIEKIEAVVSMEKNEKDDKLINFAKFIIAAAHVMINNTDTDKEINQGEAILKQLATKTSSESLKAKPDLKQNKKMHQKNKK